MSRQTITELEYITFKSTDTTSQDLLYVVAYTPHHRHAHVVRLSRVLFYLNFDIEANKFELKLLPSQDSVINTQSQPMSNCSYDVTRFVFYDTVCIQRVKHRLYHIAVFSRYETKAELVHSLGRVAIKFWLQLSLSILTVSVSQLFPARQLHGLCTDVNGSVPSVFSSSATSTLASAIVTDLDCC
jgi:hypothetical protein